MTKEWPHCLLRPAPLKGLKYEKGKYMFKNKVNLNVLKLPVVSEMDLHTYNSIRREHDKLVNAMIKGDLRPGVYMVYSNGKIKKIEDQDFYKKEY